MLQIQLEDMKKQLQCARQENIGLQSQLEILAGMIQADDDDHIAWIYMIMDYS